MLSVFWPVSHKMLEYVPPTYPVLPILTTAPGQITVDAGMVLSVSTGWK